MVLRMVLWMLVSPMFYAEHGIKKWGLWELDVPWAVSHG